MSIGFLRRLGEEPRLSRRDIWLTLVPAVIWLVGVYSRPMVIQPYCATEPARCDAKSVIAIDRPALGLANEQANQISDWTQNSSGIVAVIIPTLLSASQSFLGHITPSVALARAGTDLVIILQTTAWNGMITELTRLVTQRPRPFVYEEPYHRGQSAGNYVSFYSGHTSYSAAMAVTLVLILLSRGAPLWLMGIALATGQLLAVSTAIFRVLAGRHFVTDVLVGIVMGTLVACVVAALHRRRPAP